MLPLNCICWFDTVDVFLVLCSVTNPLSLSFHFLGRFSKDCRPKDGLKRNVHALIKETFDVYLICSDSVVPVLG
jgi:hypothetical protein